MSDGHWIDALGVCCEGGAGGSPVRDRTVTLQSTEYSAPCGVWRWWYSFIRTVGIVDIMFFLGSRPAKRLLRRWLGRREARYGSSARCARAAVDMCTSQPITYSTRIVWWDVVRTSTATTDGPYPLSLTRIVQSIYCSNVEECMRIG